LNPITEIDWRGFWIEQNSDQKPVDNRSYWDQRARDFKTYTQTDKRSAYSETFINYLAPEAGETVFDMGCGSGALAIPLAQSGHSVLACDFSAKMLESLNQHCAESGIENIKTRQVAWTDDWAGLGISEKSVDIAIASRSIMVRDLWDAFARLGQVARRKVAVTLSTEKSPCVKDGAGQVIGHRAFQFEYIFGLNILFQMGYDPELRYIESTKRNDDGSFSDFVWAFIAWNV